MIDALRAAGQEVASLYSGAPARARAPGPPAARVAAPARSFMVFFDWDKFNLTERARAVIRDAAQAARSVQHTQIEVNGYADTSGSPGYNMPLSMKRAQAVAAELVRNGVARQEIAIKAFGDTVLLVPTGPGVREPQNRRVEIIIK
jgi:outer membrane protein OmpA-like peptidoglycan-associated protein